MTLAKYSQELIQIIVESANLSAQDRIAAENAEVGYQKLLIEAKRSEGQQVKTERLANKFYRITVLFYTSFANFTRAFGAKAGRYQ